MYTATLRCGTLLCYEAPSLRPGPGDLVPCPHHEYCVAVSRGSARTSRRPPKRARPRAQDELQEWLRQRSETTVHALRRQRFTLRMIAQAEREGLVDLDLVTGRIVVRSAIRLSSSSSDPH
jgi:hypothetical protein